jgi:acyl-CoA thioesterase-1
MPAEAPVVVFLGDSLTAGFGLAEEQAFPAVVGELLAAQGLPVRVVNGGVSGDTSAGALARLDWLLTQEPDVVVVSIGGNDGLRGMPVDALEENLRSIARRARAAGARVLLTGQQIPTNYGPQYAGAFRELYRRVAREEGATLLPFLLEGVAMVPELNLPDGIHPNPEGQRRVAAQVAAALVPLLEPRIGAGG